LDGAIDVTDDVAFGHTLEHGERATVSIPDGAEKAPDGGIARQRNLVDCERAAVVDPANLAWPNSLNDDAQALQHDGRVAIPEGDRARESAVQSNQTTTVNRRIVSGAPAGPEIQGTS